MLVTLVWVLPAATLLWFAWRVIEDEPDALRSRILSLQQSEAERVGTFLDRAFADERLRLIGRLDSTQTFGDLDRLAKEEGLVGLFLKDPSGVIRFPVVETRADAPSEETVAIEIGLGLRDLQVDQLLAVYGQNLERFNSGLSIRDPLLDALRLLAEDQPTVWVKPLEDYVYAARLDQLNGPQLANALSAAQSDALSGLATLTRQSLELIDLDSEEALQEWLKEKRAIALISPSDDRLYLSSGQVRQVLDRFLAELSVDSVFSARISENVGDELPDGGVQYALQTPLNGWSVQLNLADADQLKEATHKRALLYQVVVFSVLVIAIFCSLLVIRYIDRQRRLAALKTSFVATVSHELKTPLAASRLLLDTLIEGKLSGSQKQEYIELISNENERLSILVDRFLTFSRLERGHLKIEREQVAIEELLHPITDWMTAHPKLNEGEFSLRVDQQIDFIDVDIITFQTCLINLLDNAIKFSEAPRSISLEVSPCVDHVCFVVSDNGCGIPNAEQKRIFSRFYQVDQKLSRSYEGVGLGLSIAQVILSAHGAKMKVESKPDKGARFIIELPNR
ncbi:MAG: ATP-binding protein [Verrucomicrobiota bacterium]